MGSELVASGTRIVVIAEQLGTTVDDVAHRAQQLASRR